MENELKINLNNQEKDLLLKDLCSRLPYGVKVNIISRESKNRIVHLTEDNICHLTSGWWSECKPYLFPLSSMSEEQKRESPFESSLLNAFINGYISLFEDEELTVDDIGRMLDWFNKNHLDWRGLIPMGLAIDATGLKIY